MRRRASAQISAPPGQETRCQMLLRPPTGALTVLPLTAGAGWGEGQAASRRPSSSPACSHARLATAAPGIPVAVGVLCPGPFLPRFRYRDIPAFRGASAFHIAVATV